MINTIINGDALTVLRQMESELIDFIITDPPYGVDFQSRRRTATPQKDKIANDKSPFIWWLYDAFRVLTDGGGLLCFSRWDVQQVFIDAMKIAGFAVKSVIVWDRGVHGMGDLKKTFAPRYDTCIFAIKDAFEFPSGRPADVIQCQRLDGSKLTHPNEKPVDLMRRLVEATTKPGDLILDPFAGSGTTLVAALQSGRRYIGVEISPQHYETAQRRIYEAAFAV
jgi:site-specific DNA-methyltransferase (adenine-specific)